MERQCEDIVKWLLQEKGEEAELMHIDLSSEKEMCDIFGEKFYHNWLEFCDDFEANNKEDVNSDSRSLKDSIVGYSLAKDIPNDITLQPSQYISTDFLINLPKSNPMQASSKELAAIEACRKVALNSTTPPLEKDTTLFGTVKLSHLGGVSGLFLAKIKRIK